MLLILAFITYGAVLALFGVEVMLAVLALNIGCGLVARALETRRQRRTALRAAELLRR